MALLAKFRLYLLYSIDYKILEQPKRMKLSFLILFSFLIVSCGCNDDGFESFELNTFEKIVIPFENETLVEFSDTNAEIITAVISKKTEQNYNLNSSDDESCFTSLVERNECTYKFDNSDKLYYITIEKRKFNYTDFYIYSNSQEYYTTQGLETENIEEELTNITIDGFDFNQIFYLISNNSETEFESIVYSAENGIEFIKYRNGNYLKLYL